MCRVGRQGCQIIIADTTVSRHHADVTVNVAMINIPHPAPQSMLKLKDVSKFVQTTINGKLLTVSHRECSLEDGDQIIFGACTDKFTVRWEPIVFRLSRSLDETNLAITAQNAGVVLLRQSSDASIPLLTRELCASQEDVLFTVADGGILIHPDYVSTILQLQSGVQSFPTPSEYEINYPLPRKPRRCLLDGYNFVINTGENSVSIERLIRYIGGHVMDLSRKMLIQDALVIGDRLADINQIRHARPVNVSALRQAVLDGSIIELLSREIIVSSPIQFQKDIKTCKSDWIETRATSEKVSIESSKPDASSGPVFASKKGFKKSRIASDLVGSVPLNPWNGQASKTKNGLGSKLVKFIESDMDSWLDSCNSQI